MLTLDAAAVRQSTPWNELMDAIGRLLVDGNASVPQREIHEVGLPGGGTGSLLVMPAWVDREVLGVKAVTYYPSNAGTDLPTISAGYLLFDGQTGQISAVLDGDELTLRRTAAVSALAADRLARPDAHRLLVVGTGNLAPNLALAHAAVREFDTVDIWGRSPQRAAATAQQLVDLELPAQPVDSLDDAIEQADVISCGTGATSPLVRGALVQPGTHIDLVGAFRADMREADDETVRRATLFVDTLEGALGSGDLAQPLDAGVISADDIAADLASLVAGRHPGRTSDGEITLFKSVGFALSDLAAASLVHRRIS
jgi:ornithine cyclodeaminase